MCHFLTFNASFFAVKSNSMNTGPYPMISLGSLRLNLGLGFVVTAKEIVGANIRRWIESRSDEWNQSKFAEYFGVTPPTVSRWVQGKALPEADKLDRIAALFNVKVHELFVPEATLEPEEVDPEAGLRAYLKSQGFIVYKKQTN